MKIDLIVAKMQFKHRSLNDWRNIELTQGMMGKDKVCWNGYSLFGWLAARIVE